MGTLRTMCSAAILTLCFGSAAVSDETILEDFSGNAAARWDYAADTVMGGVSDGGGVVALIDGQPGIRLSGTVSTDFNGGFIQVRRRLPDGLPSDTTGIALEVRGNNQPYFIFIRTTEMSRPWYYYSAEFEAVNSWERIRIPLEAFERSHAHLSEKVDPESMVNIAIVAFGRDHEADVSVREIALY